MHSLGHDIIFDPKTIHHELRNFFLFLTNRGNWDAANYYMSCAVALALQKCVLGHWPVIHDCYIIDTVDVASKSPKSCAKTTNSGAQYVLKRCYAF